MGAEKTEPVFGIVVTDEEGWPTVYGPYPAKVHHTLGDLGDLIARSDDEGKSDYMIVELIPPGQERINPEYLEDAE